MNKFEFYVDEKVTVWTRNKIYVRAYSYEEAEKILLDCVKEDPKNVYDMDISGSEYLYETEELMTPEENNGWATFEIYKVDGVSENNLIYSNKKWLQNSDDGQCINLRDKDLQYADLQEHDLQDVVLPYGLYQIIIGCNSHNRCAIYDSINDRVYCEYWNDGSGNCLESFKRYVEETYSDEGKTPNSIFYTQYMNAIKFFKAMRKEMRARS